MSDEKIEIVNKENLWSNNHNEKKMILYFAEKFYYEKQENYEIFDGLFRQMVIISRKNYKNKNIKVKSCVTTKFIKQIKYRDVLIVIDVKDDYSYIKKTIKSIEKICNDMNNQIRCFIINNNSKYEKDIINCIKAINICNQSERNEFIYDLICKEMDKKFLKCNYCDFKGDICRASRAKCTVHEKMGCCYSFDYAPFWDFRLTKNVRLCEYLREGKCTTKNISCKVFTCNYLKRQGIVNDTHKMLLLECFFNKKQHDVIQLNFFRAKEDILEKLKERNNDMYFWYILNRKYMIKKKKD